MKILFTGPLLDMSGFATASRSMLQALNAAKADLVARPLRYDFADPGTEYKPAEWLTDMFRRTLTDIGMIIQCTTPNIEAVPKQGVCNGIYTFIETDRIPQSWVNQLNKFDFVLVSSKYNATAMSRSGVTRPILVVPVPFDPERVVIPDGDPIVNASDRTVFYNICQLSNKKGVDALLRAYFAAFGDKPDEALLVLKTYINMGNRTNDRRQIEGFIQTVKNGCRLPIEKHPPIQLITKTFSDEQIHRLHSECHAYVNSSRTEGFCLPAFDALAHGNTLISSAYGGMAEFVGDQDALVYSGTETHCFDMPCNDPAQFTGFARWFEPSTAMMADLMRLYHELRLGNERGILSEENQKQWEFIEMRRANGQKVAESFSYERAAPKIMHQLIASFRSWKDTGEVKFDAEMGEKPKMELVK